MEFVNYVVLVFGKTFEVLFIAICPFLALAYLMQVASGLVRNRLSATIGAKGFAYFTAVGTVTHELGHLLAAVIFRHKIVKVSLFNPQADGTLGYVSHSYNKKSLYQRIGNFFIGTAPIYCGVFVIYLLTKIFLPEAISTTASLTDNALNFLHNFFSWDFLFSIKGVIYLYLVFVISLNITLSPPDIKGALDGFLVMLIALFFLLFASLWYVDIPMYITAFFYDLVLLCLQISLITFFILGLSYILLTVFRK